MTMIKKATFVICAIILYLPLAGQKTDYGIWYEAKAEKKIYKALRLDFEASIRTDQRASHVEKFYFEPGLRYKFNDYFDAGIYYRLIEQEEDDGRYHARHRWFLQMKGSSPQVARFTLSLRCRIQEQFKTFVENAGDDEGEWYLRTRLEIDYNIKGIPLKPYLNTEMHSGLFAPNEYLADKWRSMIGLEYTLNKKHKFGIEYIYNESRVTKPAYMNIIGVTYSISL